MNRKEEILKAAKKLFDDSVELKRLISSTEGLTWWERGILFDLAEENRENSERLTREMEHIDGDKLKAI